MQNFGVNVDDDVAQQIERLRTRADDDDAAAPEIVSRSQVIRELIDIGLLAESILDESDEDLADHADKRELVRQALLARVDE